jgi:hypothetical protein
VIGCCIENEPIETHCGEHICVRMRAVPRGTTGNEKLTA